MRTIGFQLFVAGLAATGIHGAARDGDAAVFDHQEWNVVLSRFVDERGPVDYEALSHPNLIDYVNRFRADASPIPGDYTVRFLEYDKQLNRPTDSGGS